MQLLQACQLYYMLRIKEMRNQAFFLNNTSQAGKRRYALFTSQQVDHSAIYPGCFSKNISRSITNKNRQKLGVFIFQSKNYGIVLIKKYKMKLSILKFSSFSFTKIRILIYIAIISLAKMSYCSNISLIMPLPKQRINFQRYKQNMNCLLINVNNEI